MGASNDEMFKICLNICVGIGAVLIQPRLQLLGGENMWPLHIVSIVAAFFPPPSFSFFKNAHRKLALVIEFLQNHNIQ